MFCSQHGGSCDVSHVLVLSSSECDVHSVWGCHGERRKPREEPTAVAGVWKVQHEQSRAVFTQLTGLWMQPSVCRQAIFACMSQSCSRRHRCTATSFPWREMRRQ